MHFLESQLTAVEDTVGLRAVEVPDKLFVDSGGAGGHHAVDPVGIEERLVDDRGYGSESAKNIHCVGKTKRASEARPTLEC